jgi:hypothetical protein
VTESATSAYDDFVKGKGTGWDLSGAKEFDFGDFFQSMVDCEQLLVHRDELTWMHSYVKPERPADVFLNLSCGTQHTPHLLLEAVAVFKALGVNFASGAGRQFCCGKVYATNGRPDASARMGESSIGRMASYQPKVAVQWCHSCQMTFSNTMQQRAERDGGEPEFVNVQVTSFLEQRLRDLGDKIPWKKRLNVRVLIEDINPVHGTPTHKQAREAAERVLNMVPGVEVVGTVNEPSLGAPCRTKFPGGPSVLSEATTHQIEKLQAELQAQADALAANTISCWAHLCHREWSKFGTDTLGVRNYMSIVAEALGVEQPDRFQQSWKLGDPEKVLETTRPLWESWNLDEAKARSIAYRFFEPKYEANIPRCACGGDLSKCDDAGPALISLSATR